MGKHKSNIAVESQKQTAQLQKGDRSINNLGL
jgi:hypothetical protein